MAVQIIVGDCREVLDTLPDQSVHCVVTSPPFWGLRDYGLPPLVWGGDSQCEHVWGTKQVIHQRGKVGDHSTLEGGLQAGGDGRLRKVTQGVWCQHCGAWRGSLGLEPTPELYVEHLVGIFQQVRRVLRDDGTVWLNLGDSYAGSGPSGASYDSKSTLRRRELTVDGAFRVSKTLRERGLTYAQKKPISPAGLKPKDLIGIPWRVAFALQADGWWLRSDIIWQKPNCMPESVRDRPTMSHEYLFLLAKSERYFYDADAIRESNESGLSDIKKMIERKARIGGKHKVLVDSFSKASQATNIGRKRAVGDPTTGRNCRTVWTIATCPFPGAHFATFPPALVEPCIMAGTSERECCPDCGAPWERVVERIFVPQDDVSLDRGIRGAMGQKSLYVSNTWEGYPRGTTQTTTIGWRPTCPCYDMLYYCDLPRTRSARKRHQQDAQDAWFPRARQRPGLDTWDTVPAVVLDLFGGAGTTGLVADQLGRGCILIELKDEYGEMARERILRDLGPMFTQVSVERF